VATGNLGESLRTQEPVLGKLVQGLPITVELSLMALVMAACFGIPLGIVSAIRRNSAVDFWARFAGLAGLSVPNFWLATMLLLISSLAFQWVPNVVWIPPTSDLLGIIEQVFGLPGVGWFLLQGVYNRDYPVVQATALLLVVVVGVISLAVDLAYAYLDPRITYA